MRVRRFEAQGIYSTAAAMYLNPLGKYISRQPSALNAVLDIDIDIDIHHLYCPS